MRQRRKGPQFERVERNGGVAGGRGSCTCQGADCPRDATQVCVHTHSWTIGDFIIWDNRTTIHRALPFEDRKYRRILARQGIDEDRRPIEEMREIAASH